MSQTARAAPEGTEDVGSTEAALVEGSQTDRRRLTIDFAGFVQRLQNRPPLDHDRLARLMAGVDLITGLAGPPEAGFASSTPGVGKDAELSEQLGAITDEALAAAEEILNSAPAAEDEFETEQVQHGAYGDPPFGAELALALSRLGNDEISAARQSLLRSRPSIDRAVAAEFI